MKWVWTVPVFLCYAVATIALALLVLVGVALTGLYRRKGWPAEQDAGNCWAFAIPKWLQAGTFENSLRIRSSEHVKWIPHVQFMPGPLTQYIEESMPVRPGRGWRGVLKSFWHKAKIRKGIGEE